MYVGEMVQFALGSQMLVMGLAMLLGSLCIRTKKEVAPAAAPICTAPTAYQAPAYTAPVTSWTCPKCGTANEVNSRFCQGCGSAMQ